MWKNNRSTRREALRLERELETTKFALQRTESLLHQALLDNKSLSDANSRLGHTFMAMQIRRDGRRLEIAVSCDENILREAYFQTDSVVVMLARELAYKLREFGHNAYAVKFNAVDEPRGGL
jgi:hypothetical protein